MSRQRQMGDHKLFSGIRIVYQVHFRYKAEHHNT